MPGSGVRVEGQGWRRRKGELRGPAGCRDQTQGWEANALPPHRPATLAQTHIPTGTRAVSSLGGWQAGGTAIPHPDTGGRLGTAPHTLDCSCPDPLPDPFSKKPDPPGHIERGVDSARGCRQVPALAWSGHYPVSSGWTLSSAQAGQYYQLSAASELQLNTRPGWLRPAHGPSLEPPSAGRPPQQRP